MADFLICDLDTGTYFSASNAVIIDLDALDEDKQDDFVEGSDSNRCVVAEEHGNYIEDVIDATKIQGLNAG